MKIKGTVMNRKIIFRYGLIRLFFLRARWLAQHVFLLLIFPSACIDCEANEFVRAYAHTQIEMYQFYGSTKPYFLH